MKHLKLYEQQEQEYSFGEYCLKHGFENSETNITCSQSRITNLDGIENFTKLQRLNCLGNKLTSLKGIENCQELYYLRTQMNELSSVEELGNCVALKDICCGYHNKLTSLKGIEKLTNLISLQCSESGLKNLEELRHLNLKDLYVPGNPFEVPMPIQLYKLVSDGGVIPSETKRKFCTYEFQENFIEEYPGKIADLTPYLNSEIIEEYRDLLDFFNIKY